MLYANVVYRLGALDVDVGPGTLGGVHTNMRGWSPPPACLSPLLSASPATILT